MRAVLEKLFICSGCGNVTSNLIDLMSIETDGFIGENERLKAGFIDVIPPGCRFRLEVILELREKRYAELILNILSWPS